MKRWISTRTAAKLRKCSVRNITDLIKRGKLEAKKDEGGKRWLILMEVEEASSEETAEETSGASEATSALQEQLSEKDGQIKRLQDQVEQLQEELSQVRSRSDTIILQLTRQLEQSQGLLEYHQGPWYRRWFRRGRSEGE